MKLLVIEDNPRLSERLKQQLQKWHIVEIAHNGHDAIQLAATNNFDQILLDLGLPDTPGIEVCKTIRDFNRDTPLLVVSGLDTTESRVELLEAGADDYITKPFEIAELKARINALARRRIRNENQPLLHLGDLVINLENRTVERQGISIILRRKEFDILEYLVRNTGRVMSRQMIINHAWSATSASWTGSVDVHIKQLRDKVDKPFSASIIKTSYGVGYMAVDPNS